MSKLNTLHNYFSSPKASKKPNDRPISEASTPKKPRNLKAKARTPSEGKENKKVQDRKRIYVDDDDEEENKQKDNKPRHSKKPRLVIPDVESCDDSEDDYKPDPQDESESEPESEPTSESEEELSEEKESPEVEIKKKKRVINKALRGPLRKTKINFGNGKAESKTSSEQQISAPGTSNSSRSWPHLKYDFLQPDKIRDIKRKAPNDPDYDPRTLYVPLDFLNKQTPAIRQWWEMKSQHFDTVLFFKVGKFYELYHMDAVIGVNELNLTFMKGEFAHSGFPEVGYGRFSASLIEKGYKVARVEQTENPEMMTERCKKMSKPTKFDKVVKREICQISTKGTRVYTAMDIEPASSNSSYLLSLVEKSESYRTYYGVCFVDTTIGDFYLGQFEDDRCTSRLLTLLAHHPPVHIVYQRGNLSEKTLQLLNNSLASCFKEPLRESQFWSSTIALKNLHEGDYFKKSDNFEWPEGLRPYLNPGDSLGLTPASDKELAVHALGGCLFLLKDYLLEQQLLAQGRFRTYVPPDSSIVPASSKSAMLANHMVLDAITIRNLRIFGDGSLYKLLDRCCSAFGKRLLRELVCRPSCRKEVIIERQEAIKELMENNDAIQNARSLLSGIPDLERLLSKIHSHGSAARMKNHPDGRAIMFEAHTYSKRKIMDFIKTLNGFETILEVIDLFQGFDSSLIRRSTRLEPDGEFPSLRDTLEYFKTAFDHEEAKKVGSIHPKKGVDHEYDSVMLELEQIKSDAENYLQKQRKHFGVKVTFHGTDKKRYQLEIPESAVKKIGSGYELQSQRKGFKRYYTAEARELLRRHIKAEELRNSILKDLNRRVFEQFSDKHDMWSVAVQKVSILDVLISLSLYASSDEMCIPEINDGSEEKIITDIRDGRHPCIPVDNFIPNDTLLGTDDSPYFMILTGPNMGGKTTLMRQVAIITIMAQIGSFVPASSCRLTLVDRIFTRLGACDNIIAGQSTFLVELKETAAILQHATPYSLVLLDELGRGTATFDGTAIAASVVDSLVKLNCRSLFSTHYHSLVEDYKDNKNIRLAHMACMVENEEVILPQNEDENDMSQETVTFLYKLTDGACPKSYGFNAARLAKVPSEVIIRAYEISKAFERQVKEKHLFGSLCGAANGAAIREIINAM